MRVVLVSLARRGGMVHYTAELANAMVGRADTSVLISSSADRTWFSRKLAVLQAHAGGSGLRGVLSVFNPWTWYGLYRRIQRLKADVIHITGTHQLNPAVAVLVRLLGKPLVYTVHDPAPHPRAPIAIRVADQLAARMADHVVVLTRYGRRQLLGRGFSAGQITVIPHPMYSIFRRWRRRRRARRNFALCIGRLEPYKGLEILVAAFERERLNLPGWRLIIAGSGRLPAMLRVPDRSGIEIINRYLSEREVAGLMEQAGVVVLPYTSATQSGILALAQAFGCPLIATAVGGIPESIVQGETGVLVEPNSARALGRALVELISDRPRRARMGRAIERDARKAVAPARIAEQHSRMYQKVMARLEAA